MVPSVALALLASASSQLPAEDPTRSLLERVDRLEARVGELEARNKTLERELEGARAVPRTIALQQTPAFRPEDSSSFTFRPHMVFQQDTAAFFGRKGGYDFSDGTLLRHASIWAEGEYGPLSYTVVLDFPNGGVSVTDAWLRYRFKPTFFVTAGLHKAPFGFQYSNNDNLDIFIERSMFANAAAIAGAGRRVGVSATFQNDRLTLAGGVFGDNAGLGRGARASAQSTPEDSWGFDGRAAWRPVLTKNATVSLGLSGYRRQSLRVNDVADAVRFTDRPNVRVDGGNIADSGVVTNVKTLDYLGAEAVGIFGPVLLSGEYGSAWLRRGHEPDVRFDGFYAMSSVFLTGERHGLVRGQLARLRPASEVGKGGFGALELTLRYDSIDLSDTPVPINRGNRASAITGGLNWYLTPYAKLLINYVRFQGRNSPLDPVGDEVKGDVLATRLHVDM